MVSLSVNRSVRRRREELELRKMDSMDVIVEGTLMHAQAARKTDDGRGRWREGPS